MQTLLTIAALTVLCGLDHLPKGLSTNSTATIGRTPITVAVKLQEAPAVAEGVEIPALKASEVEELKKLVDKPAKVTGKVVEVYKPASGNLVVLNFGKDIKTCFKVAINKRDFANWDGGVEAIEKLYADKELTVTGKIVLYKETPEIVVSAPKEIVVAAE